MSHSRPHTLLTTIFVCLLALEANSQNLENAAEQDPIRVSGSVGLSMLFFNGQGRTQNRSPFTWLVRGNPVVSLFGISFPFQFTVSEQQRDFRQPFNQYGVSPTYKWITLHAGYRNIQYSNFSMAGHTILGGGFDINPGKFRAGFIYGRLLRQVSPGTTTNDGIFLIPSFRRMGGSLRLGYGTEENFVDLILVKASDILHSLDSIPETNLTPQENLVVSLVTHQQLFKKWSFDMEYAQSATTKDFRYENVEQEGLFLTNTFNFIMDLKPTTVHASAIDIHAGYQNNHVEVKAHFKRIDPDFQSMGAYFFQNDLQNITVEPSFNMWSSRINLSGSIGYQEDNLKSAQEVTTKRTITSINAVLRPWTPYTATITYANYDIGQRASTVYFDSIPQITQATQSVNINNVMNFTGKNMAHLIMINFNSQTLTDRNNDTNGFTEYESEVIMGSYLISWLKLHLSTTLTYMHTSFDGGGNSTRIEGPTVTLSKSLKNRFNISVSQSLLTNRINDLDPRTINRLMVNVGLSVKKKHNLNIRYYLNKSTEEVSDVNNYTEQKGEINYVYRF